MSLSSRLVVVATLFATCVFVGRPAAAQAPRQARSGRAQLHPWLQMRPAPEAKRSPFQLELAADLQITFTALLVAVAPRLFEGTGPRELLKQDRTRLNALDRGVVGNASSRARVTSDIAGLGCAMLPHLVGLAELLSGHSKDGAEGYMKDTLVLAETLAINVMTTNLVKYMARRPRPYTYALEAGDTRSGESNATLSFYSGHTSTAFSMATAASYLFMLRHPQSKMVVPFWLTSHALASGVAVTRVLAGKHFWSDVMVGAVAGSAVGMLVPYLHRGERARRWLRGTRLVPILHEGGFGIAAMRFW